MDDNLHYTPGLRHVMQLSKAEAGRLGHSAIRAEHFLLGIIQKGDGLAAQTLLNLGLDLQSLGKSIETLAPPADRRSVRYPEADDSAAEIVRQLPEIGKRMGHSWFGTEHLLLAIMEEGKSLAAQALLEQGLDLERVQNEVLNVIAGDDASKVRDPRSDTRFLLNDATPELQQVVAAARELSFEHGALQTDSGHLLMALLANPESVGGRALRRLLNDNTALHKLIEDEQSRS